MRAAERRLTSLLVIFRLYRWHRHRLILKGANRAGAAGLWPRELSGENGKTGLFNGFLTNSWNRARLRAV